MPFPEFTPTLDEKFKFATFSLTRLNSESIFSLIVSSSSLTFTSPSFVSGSLVPQTTNPQTFDVYSVVSVIGAGANPFTLNSDGTYNYQIPTPLPTSSLVLTYMVTRGTKTATATLTLIFNPFPLCSIEDPNTSDFNLKIYHSAGSSNLSVVPSNTFDGLSYPRSPITGAIQTSGRYSITPVGTYSYYKWRPEDPTQVGGGSVVFSTPPTWGVASITYSGGGFGLSLRYGGASFNWGAFFINPAPTANTEVIISHGTPILPDLSNFSMTIGGVPAILTPTTQGNGFNPTFGTTLGFNSRRAIGCFLAAVERPADFKVTRIPIFNTTLPAIPLATQTRENGSPIALSRVAVNTQTLLRVDSLNTNYKRFRLTISSVGGAGTLVLFVLPGSGISNYTVRQVSTGGSVGSNLNITWDNGGNLTGINYVPIGSVVGTWEIVFATPTSVPVVTQNGIVRTGVAASVVGTTSVDHQFYWANGLESFEAWTN